MIRDPGACGGGRGPDLAEVPAEGQDRGALGLGERPRFALLSAGELGLGDGGQGGVPFGFEAARPARRPPWAGRQPPPWSYPTALPSRQRRPSTPPRPRSPTLACPPRRAAGHRRALTPTLHPHTCRPYPWERHNDVCRSLTTISSV